MIPVQLKRRVIFPAIYGEGGVIVYPDDIGLFENTVFEDDNIIADYSGVLPLTEKEPEKITLLASYDFLNLLSQSERIQARELAESDPIIKDFMAMLDKVQNVSLQNQDTIDGIYYLYGKGVFDLKRAQEILAGEKPNYNA